MFYIVTDLITEMDPNHDGKITYQEFVLIMKYIEQKNGSSLHLSPSAKSMQSKSPSNISEMGS